MAYSKKLIHFATKANFETLLAANNILDTSICFIQDAKQIWTHGVFYASPITEEEIKQLFGGNNIKLDGYVEMASPVNISDTDTVNEAFGKIEEYLGTLDELNAILVDTGDVASDPAINDYITPEELNMALSDYATSERVDTLENMLGSGEFLKEEIIVSNIEPTDDVDVWIDMSETDADLVVDEIVVSDTAPTSKGTDFWLDTSDSEAILPVEDAPSDGKLYARQDMKWEEVKQPDLSYLATKTELTTHAAEAKEYTDQVINDLVGQAPAALDTIYELADAIENNEGVVETLNSAITNKLDKTEAEEIYATKASVGLRVSDFLEDPVDIRTLSGALISTFITDPDYVFYGNALKMQDSSGTRQKSLDYIGFIGPNVPTIYYVYFNTVNTNIRIYWSLNNDLTDYIEFPKSSKSSAVASAINARVLSGVIYVGKMKQLPI